MPQTTPAAYQQSDHVNHLPLRCAVPPGNWRRASAGKDGTKGRPDLSTEQILRALVGTHKHRGRVWSANDRSTYDEVLHRSWRWLELQQRRFLTVPTWITPDVLHPRFWPFVGALVAAYRAGALGVLLSYEEGAAYFGVSRRTWARWVAYLTEAGLIRLMPTWLESSSDGRGRDRGRNLYQLGPELEKLAGDGLLEGLGEGALRSFRNRMARAARKKAKRRRYDRLSQVWSSQRDTEDARDGAAQEATEDASREKPTEIVRSSPKSHENPKGSAILTPHSPPGRASPGPGPEGEETDPSDLEKERALRARDHSSLAPDKRPSRQPENPAVTSNQPRCSAEQLHEPPPIDPAANEIEPTPGRRAAVVPTPNDAQSATTATAKQQPPSMPDRQIGLDEACAKQQPSPTPARQELGPDNVNRRSVNAVFGDAVRSNPQLSFWRDLPRDVLEDWGLATGAEACQKCGGDGELGTAWDEATQRRVRVVCDRCCGSGVKR